MIFCAFTVRAIIIYIYFNQNQRIFCIYPFFSSLQPHFIGQIHGQHTQFIRLLAFYCFGCWCLYARLRSRSHILLFYRPISGVGWSLCDGRGHKQFINFSAFIHIECVLFRRAVCMCQIYIHTVNTIVFHDLVLFFASFRCPLMCTQTMCLNNTCKIFRSLRVFFYLFSLSFGEFVYYFYDHFRQTQYTTV